MTNPSPARVALRHLRRTAMPRGELGSRLQSALDHLIDGDPDEAVPHLEIAMEHYDVMGDDEAWDELNDVLLDAEAGKATGSMTRTLDALIRHAR